MNFDIRRLLKPVKKIQVSLKSEKKNGYFTWRPMHIDDISLNSSNDRCFRQKSWRKSKQIFYLQYIFIVYEVMWNEHKMLFCISTASVVT
jgi:hypothetical protein